MIAITFALPAESSDFRDLLQERRRVSSGGVEFIRGKRHGKTIALFHTGVGRKICQRRIPDFLREQAITCLISAGFAGGLTNEVSVGELLLAENFSNNDFLDFARKLLAQHRLRFGNLHTTSTIIHVASQRWELATKTGAMAVDMETEFIARSCLERDIPLLSLRAISDTPLEPFPAPPAILFDLERQRTRFAPLVFHLTRHPISALRMIPFARRISRVRRALTSALEELLRSDLP